MSYVAYAVWPDGIQRYLWRGLTMDYSAQATQHPHPSHAWRAADAYRAKHPSCIVGVLDPSDPERVIS